MKGNTFLRVIGIIVSIVLILSIGAAVTVYLMFPPEKMKTLVVPQVEKALGRSVSVGSAHLSLVPLGVSLANVEISNTAREGFSNGSFISLDNFQVQISVMSIFKGYPEIAKIVLNHPKVLIETDSTGSYNYSDLALLAPDTTKQEAKKTGLPMLPIPITLKKFEIIHGEIVYHDRASNQQIVVGDINQRLKVSIDKELRDIRTSGSLVLSRVSVKTNDIAKPLSDLTVTLTHDIHANLRDGTANIASVRLSLQKVYLNCKGTISGLNDTPVFDLGVNSDPVAIKDLLADIPQELLPMIARVTAGGTAELALAVQGPLTQGKSLPVKGKLTLKNVSLKYTSLPKSINNCNADIDFTDNSIMISALTMRLGDNPIDIKGSVVNFSRPLIDLALAAKVDLTDLKDIVELPRGVALSGRVNADIAAKGEADPANPGKLDVKGTVDLNNLTVLWPPLVKPAYINGAFTLSSKAIGQNLSVHVGQSSLTMSAVISNYLSMVLGDSTKHFPRPSIDFKLSSPLLDVDEILQAPDTTSGESTESEESGPMIAPLPGVDVAGNVTALKIIYHGIELANMNTQITVKNDIADVVMKTGFSGGSVDETVHGDLRNVNNVSVTDKVQVNSVQVNDIMGKFGTLFIRPATPLNRELLTIQNSLFGKVTLNGAISAAGGSADAITKSLSGTISLSMNDGRIQNAPALKGVSSAVNGFLKTGVLPNFDTVNIKNLTTTITIGNGRVMFDNLKLLSDAGDWSATGSVGFDANLSMLVSNKLTKAISSTITAGEDMLKSKAGSFLEGTPFAGAAGLLQNVHVIPRDKDGRVTVKFGLEGPVTSPRIVSVGFGEGGSAAQQANPARQNPRNIQQELQQKQQQLQQRLNAQKDQINEELQRKLGSQNSAINAQKKQPGDQLKTNVIDKLKTLHF